MEKIKIGRFWDEIKSITLSELLITIISGYLLTNIMIILKHKESIASLDFVQYFSLSYVGIGLLVYSYIAVYLKLITNNMDTYYYLFMAVSICFGLLIIVASPKDIFFSLLVVGILGYIIFYALDKVDPLRESIPLRSHWTLLFISICFVGVTILFASATVARYKCFHASTYDLGIFTQMYESMRVNGSQLTTLEREYSLSHFAIHFSPIFYVLLPGYLLFTSPSYLLIMQSLILFSGVFPIFLLCKHYKFTSVQQILISITYLVYPAIIGGQFYDFHETLFMPVLLLWMIYFYEKKKIPFMYLFVLLTLMVKEDAPLYLIFWGIFLMLEKEEYIHGIIVTLLSLASFGVVSALMVSYGNGIMMHRFDLFLLPEETGAMTFIKNIIYHPSFAIRNILNLEKFKFIIYMVGPLLCIPLISKKYARFLLIVPMLLLNLLTNYPYQFDIGFQYSFAPGALLFFLYIYNMKDLSIKWQQFVVLAAVIASFIFMMTTVNDKLTYYHNVYKDNETSYKKSEELLKMIPREATVISEDFITPHLYFVEDLYKFPANVEADYLIFYNSQSEETERRKSEYLIPGAYELIGESDLLMVYKATDY